ncbi:exodeoxyribonuclease VII large subunit [Spiroplasma clarkii]|uniref:exodeoxyribonuclease VII large subunit n=1 Tax=Spiroplasma clarkii TaxID=2139 RepID=UPI001649B25D|nr:exodeoxyribonuclease VII large subunit [Spiroplasma clarkii]
MQVTEFIKISEFSDLIKEVLENERSLKDVAVKGEVANLTFNKSGHVYFSLKDAEAKVDCAIWKVEHQS